MITVVAVSRGEEKPTSGGGSGPHGATKGSGTCTRRSAPPRRGARCKQLAIGGRKASDPQEEVNEALP